MTLKLITTITASPSDIRTLKPWDQLNPSDRFSAAERPNPITGAPQGQFSFYTPYFINSPGNWVGTWSSNFNHSVLTNATMQKIMGMQIPDECTTDQKANWLMNGGNGNWGAPMRGSYKDSLHWRDALGGQQSGAVYAGQQGKELEKSTFY